MAKKKTIDSLIKTPGVIRGVLKRKKITALNDPEGNPVNIDYVKDHLLIKDNFVRDIGELWVDAWRRMRHLKKLLLEGGPAMYDYLARNDDVRHDSKGGFTEYDFSKNLKIVVSYSLRYDIDDSLMKRSADYMDRFLENTGEPELVKIVKKAFRQQNDQYDVKALRRLNQLNITDKDFAESMRLMNEAITSTPTKLRTEFYVRARDGEFKALPLNISYVEPEGSAGLTDDIIDGRLSPDPGKK